LRRWTTGSTSSASASGRLAESFLVRRSARSHQPIKKLDFLSVSCPPITISPWFSQSGFSGHRVEKVSMGERSRGPRFAVELLALFPWAHATTASAHNADIKACLAAPNSTACFLRLDQVEHQGSRSHAAAATHVDTFVKPRAPNNVPHSITAAASSQLAVPVIDSGNDVKTRAWRQLQTASNFCSWVGVYSMTYTNDHTQVLSISASGLLVNSNDGGDGVGQLELTTTDSRCDAFPCAIVRADPYHPVGSVEIITFKLRT